jgi:hypothetical protein
MRTFVISDLHNRWEWVEEFLGQNPHDEAVLLGDYFDNYQDDPEIARATARWLKKSLQDPRRFHLRGNHDAYYALPLQRNFRGGGFHEDKLRTINQVLTPQDWIQLHVTHFTQGFWCSHAGLPNWMSPNRAAYHLEKSWHDLQEKNRRGFDSKKVPKVPKHLRHTLWQRWADFWPVRHVHQIVGHTQGKQPRQKIAYGDLPEKNSAKPKFYQVEYYDRGFAYPADVELYKASHNLCLDTFNRHIAVIEDGKLEVIENPIQLPPEPEPTEEDQKAFREHQEKRIRHITEAMLLADLSEPILPKS